MLVIASCSQASRTWSTPIDFLSSGQAQPVQVRMRSGAAERAVGALAAGREVARRGPCRTTRPPSAEAKRSLPTPRRAVQQQARAAAACRRRPPRMRSTRRLVPGQHVERQRDRRWLPASSAHRRRLEQRLDAGARTAALRLTRRTPVASTTRNARRVARRAREVAPRARARRTRAARSRTGPARRRRCARARAPCPVSTGASSSTVRSGSNPPMHDVRPARRCRCSGKPRPPPW